MIRIASFFLMGMAILGLTLGYAAASANHHRLPTRFCAAGLGALIMSSVVLAASVAAAALLAAIAYLT